MPRVSSHFDLQDPRLSSLVIETIAPVTISTDANVTLTPAQVLSGWIFRSIGAARTDTLPSAAALVEALQGVMVNHAFTFRIRNISTGAFTETLAVGAGGTVPTTGAAQTLTTAQNTDHSFRIIFTNVGVGTEAYNLYSMSAGGSF